MNRTLSVLANLHYFFEKWLKQEVWVDKAKSLLLPVKYVHLVFTLPVFLNEFVLIDYLVQKVLPARQSIIKDIQGACHVPFKGKQKKMTLSPQEFIRRFMFHILPERFCKVRYYGILFIKNRKDKLLHCLALIGKVLLPPCFEGLKMIQILEFLTGRDYSLCTCCQTGHMQRYKPPE